MYGKLISGWQVQGIYLQPSGAALGFGNAIFTGNLKDVPISKSERTIYRWFNTGAGFERDSTRQLGSNIRTLPSRFSGIRGDGLGSWDLSASKRTQLTERTSLQFRAEFYNAWNQTFFAAPNTTPSSTAFGTVTAESLPARTIQFGLKLSF